MAIERREQIIVGVNRFQSEDPPLELLQIDESAARAQEEKLAALRARRDNALVGRTLDALRRAAEGSGNTMPFILDAVRAYATLGRIAMRFATFSAPTRRPPLRETRSA